jgi:hypothetical protein
MQKFSNARCRPRPRSSFAQSLIAGRGARGAACKAGEAACLTAPISFNWPALSLHTSLIV